MKQKKVILGRNVPKNMYYVSKAKKLHIRVQGFKYILGRTHVHILVRNEPKLTAYTKHFTQKYGRFIDMKIARVLIFFHC